VLFRPSVVFAKYRASRLFFVHALLAVKNSRRLFIVSPGRGLTLCKNAVILLVGLGQQIDLLSHARPPLPAAVVRRGIQRCLLHRALQ
jgi:hypothetical protein